MLVNPPHDYPGYGRPINGVPMEHDPASREGRLAALDHLVTAAGANVRADDQTWCAHDFWDQNITWLLGVLSPLPGPSVVAGLFAKLPACRTARCAELTAGADAA